MVTSRSGATAAFSFDEIIGESKEFNKAVSMGKRFAKSPENVLIIGESGTGKELFAQSMHNDYRPHGPFIAVNCAAMPRNLIESELFGYEPGSFTGAERSGRPGKIELAHGGTQFLDEIGDMPLELQAVLLRVLEDKQVMRIGGRRYKKVDFRLIAATNKNLYQMIQEGLFREDLYFRLSVLSVNLPPLRERGNDVELLSQYFIKNYCKKMGWKLPKFSTVAANLLKTYKWPGNVRQLENAVIYAANTAQNDLIEADDLPAIVLGGNSTVPSTSSINSNSVQTIEAMEKVVIENALYKTRNNITKAAELLGIGKSTLYRKLKEYDIAVED
jgi:transcriptional regulator with PAS, ATPase and Fis domain